MPWHRLGGINTTVNPLYTVHELTNQLKDAGAKYLLTIPTFYRPSAWKRPKPPHSLREVFVFGEAAAQLPLLPYCRMLARRHPSN